MRHSFWTDNIYLTVKARFNENLIYQRFTDNLEWLLCKCCIKAFGRTSLIVWVQFDFYDSKGYSKYAILWFKHLDYKIRFFENLKSVPKIYSIWYTAIYVYISWCTRFTSSDWTIFFSNCGNFGATTFMPDKERSKGSECCKWSKIQHVLCDVILRFDCLQNLHFKSADLQCGFHGQIYQLMFKKAANDLFCSLYMQKNMPIDFLLKGSLTAFGRG